MSFFTVNSVTAGYGNGHVIKNISFELEAGSIMGILGENGSGKTTLLKSLCGIIPHEGHCVLDRCTLEELSPRRIARAVSYIPQRSGITIDLSVLDVVLMGFNPKLRLLEYPDSAMKEQAIKALEQVGLRGKENVSYLQLSEGQKQLCILARTLAADGKLFLLDEPESALDFRYRYRILEILRDCIQEKEKSAVVTLHDPMLALNYCDRLLILSRGEIIGILNPKRDRIQEMEKLLSDVYGPVSVQVCRTAQGKPYLVMLKEDV